MDRCIRDDVLTNKAIVYVNINVILVTEVALIILFRPLGVNILLSHFMRIILPFFWDLSLFQVFFLLFRYFLLWNGEAVSHLKYTS